MQALPGGGQVAGGQATIQQSAPNTLTIHQGSDRAILNWQSFSIGSGEAVHFLQPGVGSIALNRVVGIDPSVILGQLHANGQIFLINPNGILFGAGAQVNVAGLLATTLQIRDADFMAGRYLFAQDPLKALRSVINRGEIRISDHGYAVLVAPGVANDGVIVAHLGTTVLGSAQRLTVDLMGDGLIHYVLSDKVASQVLGPDGTPLASAVSNSGTITADGGHVVLSARASGDIFSSVVNQSGVIRAQSLVERGGVIRLEGSSPVVNRGGLGAEHHLGTVHQADGRVLNTGTLDVSAAESHAQPGEITLSGQMVGVAGSLHATGLDGGAGGNVLITSSERTVVTKDATITTSGTTQGDAGNIVVWSDKDTAFRGAILARGGETGGHGGQVEVSGYERLAFTGQADTTAPQGTTGTLLLDPQSIVVATGGAATLTQVDQFTDLPGTTQTIAPSTINAAAANVNLQAHDDITITDPIALTGAGRTLTLRAGRDIAANANVSTNNAAISMTANDSGGTSRTAGTTGDITMAPGTTINAGTGALALTVGPTAIGAFSPGTISATNLTGNAITLTTPTGTSSVTGAIAGTSLTKAGAGTLVLSGTNTYTGTTTISAGTLRVAGGTALPDTSAVTLANTAGVTLDLNGTNETIGSLAGGGTTGGNVTLGTGTLTTGGNNGTTTFSGIISGTGGLTKTGTGIMTLSGANTYTGATTINAGTLSINTDNRLGAAPSVATPGQLTLNGGTLLTTATFTLNPNRGIALGAGSGTLNVNTGTTLTYNGIVDGAGNLTKAGAGTLILGGTNTYSGATTINTGTLRVAGGAAIPDASAVTLANTSGAVLDLNGSNETIGSLAGGGTTGGNVTLGAGTLTTGGNNTSTTYSGSISGTGGLTKTGTGTMTLAGANIYSGATTINAGTLTLGAAARLADTSAMTINGGTFNLNGFAETIGSLAGAGTVTLGSGTLTTGGNNTSSTYSGIISGTGGLTKTGTGTMELAGTNTYSGATTINGGTLRVAGGAAIGDSSAVTLANTAGVTLDLNGTNETIGSLAGGGTTGGNVTLGAGTLTTGSNNTSTTYSGIISGTGGLSKTGTGTMTLSGANSYTGATTINAGTLTLGAAARLADATAMTLNGGTFNLNGFAETIGSLAGTGTVTLGAGTLTTGGNNTSTTYSGSISGTGGLTKTGTGIMTLAGANTYSGATTINTGTLRVAGGAAIGDSSAVTLANTAGVTLDLNGTNETIGSLAGGGTTGGNVTLGAGTLTTGGSNTSTTYSGIISGTGGLTKAGTGIMTLAGANTYSGATTINAGTLRLLGGAAIGDSSAVTLANTAGGTLDLNGTNETIGSLAGGGTTGGNVTLGAGTLTTGGNNTSTTYSGIISGTGGLTKTGTGTMTLAGTNTYSGATTINAGTLTLWAAARLADTSAMTINGGTFNLNGFAETIGSLAGTGTVTLGGGTLTTGGNNTSTTYSGSISGTGGLTKAGTGTMTLGGANTYSGATTINAGTLRLLGGAAIGDSSAVTLANTAGGTLDLNGTNETIGSLAGGGTTGGNVTLGAGTLTAGGNNTSTTYSGIISGTGGLIKTGTGTMTLAGANTYSGATTINAGTLSINADSRLGTAPGAATPGQLTLTDGTLLTTATFALNPNRGLTLGAGSGTLNINTGTTLTYNGIVDGAGNLTKAGAGTLVLGGANTYTGTTTISAGILRVAGGAAIGDSSAVTLANTAGVTLDLNGTNETIGSLAGGGTTGGNVTLGTGTLTTGGNNTSTTYGGIISGTGGLTKTGTGTMTLAGTNTYSGATTINGGTLTLGAAARLADATAMTLNGGTFNLNGFAETIGSLAGTGAVTLGAGTLTTGGNNTSTTYGGIISGTGGLTKSGTGTMTLAGANTYTGATTINGGTLTLGAAARLADATAMTLNGGTFNLNGFAETIGSLAGTGSVTLGAGTLTTGGDNTSTTYSGIISGTGGLTKTGTGTMELAGVNTYTGATAVSGGTLVAAVDGALGTAAGGTTVGPSGIFALTGHTAYTIPEPITLAGGTFENRAGHNSFAGPLLLTSSSALTIADGTSLALGGTVDGASALTVISGTGAIAFQSPLGGTTPLTSLNVTAGSIQIGAVTSTGVQTYSGPTSLGGTLTTTNSAIAFDSPVTLAANSTLSTGSGPITFSNAVNGPFDLTANSTGTTTFGGAVGTGVPLASLVTNAGGTTAINGGALVTTGPQTLGDPVTMNQATTLTSTSGTITVAGNVTNQASGASLTIEAPVVVLNAATTIATSGDGAIAVFADSLIPNGAAINAGSGTVSLGTATTAHTIEFGDVDTARATDTYIGSAFSGVTAGAFTIGRPTHTGDIFVTGVAAAPGPLTLITSGNGAIHVEQAPYVGSHNLGLVAGSGGITLGTDVQIGSGTLRLTTGGPITQTLGSVGAQTIGLSAGGDVAMMSPTNHVGAWAAKAPGGNVTIANSAAFTIDALSGTPDGWHPALAGLSAQAIGLNSDGLVSQTGTGAIAATSLTLQGAGSYVLANPANLVQLLGGTTTGSVQYTNASGLSLGAVPAVGSVPAVGGLISTNGQVSVSTVSGDLVVGSVASPTGSVTLHAAGSILASGNGTHVTAGGNSSLLAQQGVVGTIGAPLKVAITGGALSVLATQTIGVISGFLTGSVLPSGVLTPLAVPPGLLCFNVCVQPGSGALTGMYGDNLNAAFGTLAMLHTQTVIPTYYPDIVGTRLLVPLLPLYLPPSVLAGPSLATDGEDPLNVAQPTPPCATLEQCRTHKMR